MAKSSFSQNSFLGGEWSPQMQGRFDRDDYRSGMNRCLNIVPIEEGAAPRRSGTRLGGSTRNGAYGVLREYSVHQSQPYDIELTAGHLRIWRAGAGLVTDTQTPVTAAGDNTNGSVSIVAIAHTLTIGDQVLFTIAGATSYAGISQLLGRQFSVSAVIDVNTFEVLDALTGASFDSTLIDPADYTNLEVFRILDLDTPYAESELEQVRIVQDGLNALLLHGSHPPQTFTFDETTATLTATSFYDGPYLDIPSDGTTLTPSALTGTITFTASAITGINDGDGFLASDIGRMFRIFSEPAAWAVGTAYVTGNFVKYADVYWEAVSGSTGTKPDTDNGTHWNISTTAALWSWGTIATISSPTAFTATLHAAVLTPDNIAGGPLLYTVAAHAWQLGAYSKTTSYPAVGAYYQGRVWLGGAIKNRFDACVSNDFGVNNYVNFAPTGKDGTVADNNAISGTLNAREIENFLWMLPDEQGVLVGTQGGEWMIAASAVSEPITATSIQVREMTHYGSVNMPALKVGRAALFIHRDSRKVYEYMANYFTQKFVADNLALKAKHLTTAGIAEIAYMRELTPVIWARTGDGGLIGCTYKHDDPIKPLEFAAWHRHELGTERTVVSIQSGPSNDGKTDTLAMVTYDATTTYHYVEFLQTLWGEDDSLLTAWYVDGGAIPVGADKLVVDGRLVIRVYGLWYMVGQTVTAWGAGLDLGDFTVAEGGTIDIPLNAASSLFTDALLASITAAGCLPLSTEVTVASSGPISPTAYTMTAEENYDVARVSKIAATTTYDGFFTSTDQNYQGMQWDAVRRNLMYMYTEDTPDTPRTNTTGYSLWNGQSLKAPGAAIDPSVQFNSSVGVKNIDTGEVNFYLNYDPDNLVPTGIGGGTGTYRRATIDFQCTLPQNNGNGPGMTDPYTGNFWVNSQSCELYCFRLQDNYSQTISPLQPVKKTTDNVAVVGFTNTGATKPWTFAREIDLTSFTSNVYLYLVPRLYTAAEVAADYLLIYATFTYPVAQSVIAPAETYVAYNREVFDALGNMFLFCCTPTGGKSFKLYKFAPPTSAPYGGPTVGGGFTDITPWGGGTGPNGEGAAYTLQRSIDHSNRLETGDIIPMYLPETNDLVLIEKFFPSEKTAASVDPALMFWSCTYVHAPAGTPTWDHHSSFLTGYMSSAWAPTDINGAFYSVVDAFEVNNYLGQSDYLYNIDYTSRWFFFVCTKMSGGVSDGKFRIVLVNYSFVYGSAPAVVQVIDEQGWDDAYPDYDIGTNDGYPDYEDVPTASVAVSMNTTFNTDESRLLWDTGVFDPVTNSFWWSGGGSESAHQNPLTFCQFDPRFANRMQTDQSAPGEGGLIPGATPPFMKLSFAPGLGYCTPFCIGSTYTSQGQILRPASPQDSQTRSGPSQGKKRRMTYAAPLLVGAQGISMGVDFLTMRALPLMSSGGTVPLTALETFSGVHWGPVDADYNYDNMWCWQITRPYPATVVSVECQIETNENL